MSIRPFFYDGKKSAMIRERTFSDRGAVLSNYETEKPHGRGYQRNIIQMVQFQKELPKGGFGPWKEIIAPNGEGFWFAFKAR